MPETDVMIMRDDYLWDGSGTPDPEVQRLEALLGRLRSTPPPLDLARLEPPAKTNVWTLRYLAPLAAAAAAVILMIALSWQTTRRPSWPVARVEGQPRIGSALLRDTGRIGVGDTLSTDSASRAHINVSTIGEVTVDHDSRVRLVETREAHHRLALERGTLHASIVAPPGQFIVDTASARATDLGCAYTLHVDEEGTGIVSVTSGWVAFEFRGIESFVPAGASCRTDRTRGPGTPRYDNASQAYRDAIDDFDYGDPARRARGLSFVLHAGGGDALTLWHLLSRVDATDRPAVIEALEDQVAMPPGVTREAVLRHDKAALDLWWESLGLGDTSWWRTWKHALDDVMPGR
jgi:ferric-dicitrate binding protein FerR (iron transport regulator)